MTFFNKKHKALSFKVTIELTSTKIIAWVILVVGLSIVGLIPDIDRAKYLDSLYWVVAVMYGVKNVQEYLKAKPEPEAQEQKGGEIV